MAVGSPTPTPSTTSTVVVPPFGPTQGVSGADTASAGLYAFLIVVGLIAVSVVIFIAMNRSLKTARTNLGGSILPRREADRIPVAPYDGRRASPRTAMPEPAVAGSVAPEAPELTPAPDAAPSALDNRQPDPAPEFLAAPMPETSSEPAPSPPADGGGSGPFPSPAAPAAAAVPEASPREAAPAAAASEEPAPDVAAPDVAAPDVAAPDVAAPDVAAPDVAASVEPVPDVAAPDVAASVEPVPDVAAPPSGGPSAAADLVPSQEPVPDEPSWWTPRPPDPSSPDSPS
jgi:hypothetical protein